GDTDAPADAGEQRILVEQRAHVIEEFAVDDSVLAPIGPAVAVMGVIDAALDGAMLDVTDALNVGILLDAIVDYSDVILMHHVVVVDLDAEFALGHLVKTLTLGADADLLVVAQMDDLDLGGKPMKPDLIEQKALEGGEHLFAPDDRRDGDGEIVL